MKNERWIFFDMDGTLNRFYDVPNWLGMLNAFDPTPYIVADPLVNMNVLARRLNVLRRKGYKIGVISWLSKVSTPEYDELVTAAKIQWLNKHLKSVEWDAINIVAYGRNKWEIAGEKGILFDDESRNRESWLGESYEPAEIFDVLKRLGNA